MKQENPLHGKDIDKIIRKIKFISKLKEILGIKKRENQEDGKE